MAAIQRPRQPANSPLWAIHRFSNADSIDSQRSSDSHSPLPTRQSSPTTYKSTSSSPAWREAAAAGGALTEWYGERTTSTLFHRVTPDAYAVLRLPGHDPLHILLELDRGKSPATPRPSPAAPYATYAPIILAVPTTARAHAATVATASTGAPIAVVVWSTASGEQVLALVQHPSNAI
jgi:hypothetical protein